MNMRPKTSMVLNALALAGMLVFAGQAADAASTQSPSVDAATAGTPSAANVRNAPAAAENAAPDIADSHEVDDADVIGDIGNQDIETPDVAEVELPELETPDSN